MKKVYTIFRVDDEDGDGYSRIGTPVISCLDENAAKTNRERLKYVQKEIILNYCDIQIGFDKSCGYKKYLPSEENYNIINKKINDVRNDKSYPIPDWIKKEIGNYFYNCVFMYREYEIVESVLEE